MLMMMACVLRHHINTSFIIVTAQQLFHLPRLAISAFGIWDCSLWIDSPFWVTANRFLTLGRCHIQSAVRVSTFQLIFICTFCKHRWLTNEQLAAWMSEYTHRCSNISRRFSIGTSTQGTSLWVLEISDKPGQQEPEPNFKYIANMHGDETSGRMLLPMLAEWLCDNWQGGDERATRIVKDMHLYLMPTMNPGKCLRGLGFASTF